FGWQSIVVGDGHDHAQVLKAYEAAATVTDRPVMIIAQTRKGQGVSFLADKDGWHGKALDDQKLEQALKELGDVDHSVRGKITKPAEAAPQKRQAGQTKSFEYTMGDKVATRKA